MPIRLPSGPFVNGHTTLPRDVARRISRSFISVPSTGGRRQLLHLLRVEVPAQQQRCLRRDGAVGAVADDVDVASDLHVLGAREVRGVGGRIGDAERNIGQPHQVLDVPAPGCEPGRRVPELDDVLVHFVEHAAEQAAGAGKVGPEEREFLLVGVGHRIEPPHALRVLEDRRARRVVRVVAARPQQEFPAARDPLEAGAVLQRVRRRQRRVDGRADVLAPRAVGEAHAPRAVGGRVRPVAAGDVDALAVGRHVGVLAAPSR